MGQRAPVVAGRNKMYVAVLHTRKTVGRRCLIVTVMKQKPQEPGTTTQRSLRRVRRTLVDKRICRVGCSLCYHEELWNCSIEPKIGEVEEGKSVTGTMCEDHRHQIELDGQGSTRVPSERRRTRCTFLVEGESNDLPM